MGSGTCFPAPCPGSEPREDVVCCLANEDGPECDKTDAADCAAENGVTVMASRCEPDPCPPPTSPDIVRCCIPEDSGDGNDEDGEDNQAECEQLTTTDCADENGTPMGSGSCEPNPCAMTTTTSTTTTTTTL